MLKHIFLHLARSPEFPEGSVERGYELVAPLNASNHLDVDEWKSHKAQCHVRRFWQGEADRHGALVHHGGARGGIWAIQYAGQASGDEEPGVRLGAHRFAPDEYVSIYDEQGRLYTYKIVQLRPMKPSPEKAA